MLDTLKPFERRLLEILGISPEDEEDLSLREYLLIKELENEIKNITDKYGTMVSSMALDRVHVRNIFKRKEEISE
jgi:hypothetical protein